MHVEPNDWRPPNLFIRARLGTEAILGGLTSILGGVLIVASLALSAKLAAATDELADDAPVIDEEVVSARFVKLGVDFMEKLPNRRVNRLSTHTPQGQAISKRPRRQRPPDAGIPPENSTEDLLQRLGDRAQLFAEDVPQMEQEGSPDGIEEGTETEAQAGDIYAGQLYAFFRRGWTVPTTISDEEKNNLSVEATIEISEGLKLVSSRLRGSSGNADFDQSVTAQLDRIRVQNFDVPEPPLEVRATYVGRPVTLRFRGRQAGR